MGEKITINDWIDVLNGNEEYSTFRYEENQKENKIKAIKQDEANVMIWDKSLGKDVGNVIQEAHVVQGIIDLKATTKDVLLKYLRQRQSKERELQIGYYDDEAVLEDMLRKAYRLGHVEKVLLTPVGIDKDFDENSDENKKVQKGYKQIYIATTAGRDHVIDTLHGRKSSILINPGLPNAQVSAILGQAASAFTIACLTSYENYKGLERKTVRSYKVGSFNYDGLLKFSKSETETIHIGCVNSYFHHDTRRVTAKEYDTNFAHFLNSITLYIKFTPGEVGTKGIVVSIEDLQDLQTVARGLLSDRNIDEMLPYIYFTNPAILKKFGPKAAFCNIERTEGKLFSIKPAKPIFVI